MATPNDAPNPDGGARSIIKLLWRKRETHLKRDQVRSKDVWDIIDIVARGVIALLTVVAAIVIPIVVATIGGQVQQVVTAQITGKDYIQIALGILQSTSPETEKKATFAEKQKNKDLRQWAVSLINKTSPLPFSPKTSEELINGDTELPYFPLVPFVEEAIAEKSPLLTLLSQSIPVDSPSGWLIAFLKKDGSVFVTDHSSLMPIIEIETKLAPPKGLIFSPDEWNLIVFGERTFAICASEGHTAQDMPRYNAPIKVTPPNGIFKITVSEDSKTILVTGTDNRQIRYDLDGNQI
jgi:hypothetical protein